MSDGLKIRDASGNVIFDSERLVRYIGTATITGSNGSVTDSRFAMGTPFYTWCGVLDPFSGWMPNIYFSGNTLYWNYGSTPGGFTNVSGTIFYGVY